MTTTVFTIFNDYYQKVPEWQQDAYTQILQQNWDPAKTKVASQIISSVIPSRWGLETGKLEANMQLFFAYNECNMQGRTIEDLENYIESTCNSINVFSRLHFRFRGCINHTPYGGTMRIGWEF